MIQINQIKDPPTKGQIDDVEARLGFKIDPDCLKFLVDNNGAKFEQNIFRVSEKISSGIDQLILFDRLPYERRLIAGQVGLDVLPIAYAEGGNYLCLSNNDMGAIYFLDHEIPGRDALTKIASSWEGFLDSLRPFDPKQIKMKPGQVKSVWINPDLLKK